MPQQILLQPASREYGLHRAQYDALAKDLEEEGVLVRVVPAVEERDGWTSVPDAESYDLVIQVGHVAGAIVGTPALIEIVRRRLGGLERQRVTPCRATILANGEEHEFTVDGEDG